MQHAMMRAAELIVFEQAICIAHEIAIGEKQEFDQIIHGDWLIPFGCIQLRLRQNIANSRAFSLNCRLHGWTAFHAGYR
jgi:hypothetical protein